MFEIGDYIVYGNKGVYKVEDIGSIDSPGISKDKLYYTLSPFYSTDSKIFIPIDNQKVVMRAIMTKEEAIELIKNIKDIECLWITDEKERESVYKDAFRKCSCKELVKIIKTIYLHKKFRTAEGKKETAIDEKYFRAAEENLYGELAISLKTDREKAKEFVITNL